MAGYTYNPDMHAVPEREVAETPTEANPNLDRAPVAPGPPSTLVDATIGDPVVPGGNVFTRVVSATSQADTPDPGV